MSQNIAINRSIFDEKVTQDTKILYQILLAVVSDINHTLPRRHTLCLEFSDEKNTLCIVQGENILYEETGLSRPSWLMHYWYSLTIGHVPTEEVENIKLYIESQLQIKKGFIPRIQ